MCIRDRLSDVLGTDGNQVGADLEQAAEKNMLLEAVGRLSARERQILELRFGLSGGAEHTQKDCLFYTSRCV